MSKREGDRKIGRKRGGVEEREEKEGGGPKRPNLTQIEAYTRTHANRWTWCRCFLTVQLKLSLLQHHIVDQRIACFLEANSVFRVETTHAVRHNTKTVCSGVRVLTRNAWLAAVGYVAPVTHRLLAYSLICFFQHALKADTGVGHGSILLT